LHLVGILFPHINDDARSKPLQTDELINTTERGLVFFKPNQIATGNQQNWSNWTSCHQYNAKENMTS